MDNSNEYRATTSDAPSNSSDDEVHNIRSLLLSQVESRERILKELAHQRNQIQHFNARETTFQEFLHYEHEVSEKLKKHQDNVDAQIQNFNRKPPLATMPTVETTNAGFATLTFPNIPLLLPTDPKTSKESTPKMEMSVTLNEMKMIHERRLAEISKTYQNKLEEQKQQLKMTEKSFTSRMTFFKDRIQKIEQEQLQLKQDYNRSIALVRKEYEEKLVNLKIGHERELREKRAQNKCWLAKEAERLTQQYKDGINREIHSKMETLKSVSETLCAIYTEAEIIRASMFNQMKALRKSKSRHLLNADAGDGLALKDLLRAWDLDLQRLINKTHAESSKINKYYAAERVLLSTVEDLNEVQQSMIEEQHTENSN